MENKRNHDSLVQKRGELLELQIMLEEDGLELDNNCKEELKEINNLLKSTRKESLAFWKVLPSKEKLRLWREYQKSTFTPSHSPDDLTGREIEEIWLKETQRGYGVENSPNQCLKTNQKQFKQFDESLFKAYIDKFSAEDKRKAFELIFDSISDNMKTKFLMQSEIIDWYKRNIY